MFGRWPDLLAERLDEAANLLGAVPGVDGLVVGGSVGRGEAWPMSDIDLIPIRSAQSTDEVERLRAMLVDWWAASGRAQTLDVGWLSFSRDEAEAAIGSGPHGVAERMSDRRWLRGLDKAFGGHGLRDPLGLAGSFADWATAVRFLPEVVSARAAEWLRMTLQAHEGARSCLVRGDQSEATIRLRESASALRLVLVERWGERLGSMGREWTRFERMAERHEATALARRLAFAANAEPQGMRQVREVTPTWLLERIDLALAARRVVGEDVSADENARDQVVAFRTHVARHRPDLSGEWLKVPDPLIEARIDELGLLIDELRGP